MIPLFKVFMSKEVDKYIMPVLNSGYIGEGDSVKDFENRLSVLICNDNIVTVNSCTSAIMMSLRLAGVGQDDLVATTPMTCLATNMPILALGAKPLWIDINSDTGNMSSDSLINTLMSCGDIRKVKAIVCVHWGGYPCDMDKINEIGTQFSIPVIEDAAQAIGAVYKSDYIGNFSDYTCFSFQAIKYLTTGDGGAIAFKDEKEAERAKLMRWYGLDRTKSTDMRCMQDPYEYGYKMHMNNINAAIGIANIREYYDILKNVRSNAYRYDSGIKECTIRHDVSKPTFWLYTLLVDDNTDFIAYMKANGIECSKVHDRNDTKKIFREFQRELPGVESFDSHHVCIPVGWWLSNDNIDYIIETVNNYF